MARVYTSRQLIDPNLASYMEQVIQNRVANEANRNKEFLSSTRNMLSSIGETADDYIGRFQRKKELQNAEANKDSVSYIEDPTYRAAREEYIRTGNSQPISSYMLQKEAAKARALEAKKATENKASNEAFHNAVRLAQARPEYAKTQKAMNDAIDAGDYETAEMYKKTLQSYETEFGNVFGDDAATVLEARKKTAEAKREAAAQEQEEKKIAEKQEAFENELDAAKTKEITDKSFEMRNFIMDNFMPVGAVKDKNEQIYLANLVRNTKMTDEDKKYLLDKIYGETKQEQISKAQNAAVASKAGEKAGKTIEENENKTAASAYVGKKLNSLEWNKLDDKVKQYLNRDGSGVVSMKE